MAIKAYLSNLHNWWTVERQREALAAIHPAYPKGVVEYIDELPPVASRGRRPDRLIERAHMLRQTTRATADTLLLASLAVLARNEADFRQTIRDIAGRGWSIRITEPPDHILFKGRWDIERLVAAWRAACTQSRLEGAARRGGQASATKRKADTKAKFEIIRERWPLPSKQWPTAALLDESGIRSRNTINALLGHNRETAQARYQAALKRKATREGKK